MLASLLKICLNSSVQKHAKSALERVYLIDHSFLSTSLQVDLKK